MSKFVCDVRSSSADKCYMGKPFTGPMAHAIQQARDACDFGIPPALEDAAKLHGISVARYELLKFLRVLP